MACSLPYLVCPLLATGGYASWLTDDDVFRPYGEWVARRHPLAAPGSLDAGVPGSHPVFVTGGGYVVKFYAPHWGEDARSERRVYRLLRAVEQSRVPRPAWRAAAVLFPGEDDWPWPYAVLGRVSGQPWSIVRDQMRRRGREYMAHRVGAMVRCLHDMDWHGRGQELAAQSADRLLDRWRTAAARRAFRAAWAHFDRGQAEDCLTRALSGMPAGVLTHGDITAEFACRRVGAPDRVSVGRRRRAPVPTGLAIPGHRFFISLSVRPWSGIVEGDSPLGASENPGRRGRTALAQRLLRRHPCIYPARVSAGGDRERSQPDPAH